jgi:hypothetical protein
MAVSALRLYAVVLLDGGEERVVAPDAMVLRFRDLGAVVRQAPYAPPGDDAEDLARYEQIIARLFRRTAVLPAPYGTVFRSADQMRRWLDMNYIALSEGLHYVEGRCETRLHIAPNPAVLLVDGKIDTSAAAADSFRVLRRYAVAALTMPQEEGIMRSAYLIADDGWDDFAEHVQEQASRYEGLVFRQTGPWPPYDFVRIEFGG